MNVERTACAATRWGIYRVYSNKLRQHVACQVTALKENSERKGEQLAAVLQLDWSGDALPQASELGASWC